MPAHSYQLSTVNHQLLSWHGWQLALPPEWSPVKIDGDWKKGSILIADLHATRLALRWQSVKAKAFDADAWARGAIASEVGQLMLERSIAHAPRGGGGGSSAWRGGRLFEEPEPPGRDVWVGHDPTSDRVIEVVHQTARRTRVLRDEVLPALSSRPRAGPQHWSIFDLNCTVPEGWALAGQRLHAGDLTLTFSRGKAPSRETLIVRQVAPAALALARRPLDRWLDDQQQIWEKLYRVRGAIDAATPGRVARTIRRRRRFFFLRWIAAQRHTLVRHDVDRDRLVIVDAGTREVAERVAETVGPLASAPQASVL